MGRVRLCMLVVVLTLVGCGEAAMDRIGTKRSAEPAGEKAVAKAGAGGQAPEAKPPAAEAAVPRKIIYTATINLVVETFDDAAQQLTSLIKEFPGAYIASSDVRGTQGSRRTATWTVRVPVGPFDDFLDRVGKIGELQQRKLDSEDITDRFYDLQEEMKNNQTEEKSLRDLLEKSSGKLEDVIAVRRELASIRGKINQQQGQLQRWDKLTQLATATITIQERKDYVPPTAPEFGTSIGRTFRASVDSLLEFCKGVVLFVVALVPWLPVIALLFSPFWLLIRRRRRRKAIPEVTAVEAAPTPPPAS